MTTYLSLPSIDGVEGYHGTPGRTVAFASGRFVHYPDLAGIAELELIQPLLSGCRCVNPPLLASDPQTPTVSWAIGVEACCNRANTMDVKAIIDALSVQKSAATEAPPNQYMSVPRLEWEYIQHVLRENDGNIAATARALKMHRRTLQRKLAKRPPSE